MVIEEIHQAALARLAGTEQAFRNASCLNDRIEWRSELTAPVRFLENQSQAVDLVVVGLCADDDGGADGMAVDVGDVLMGLNRPILIVPPGFALPKAGRIIIGPKNTQQTRRAVTDAMPIPRRAEAVRVFRVADSEDRAEVEEVVRYLSQHDVNATAHPAKLSGWTVADEMQKAAPDFDADLTVTGAYSYSRLREWFFGGVTCDLLAKASVCCLMSY